MASVSQLAQQAREAGLGRSSKQACQKCGKPAAWLNWLSPNWAVCNPCQTGYVSKTVKAVSHRPTRKEVQTAVNKILQYVGALKCENQTLNDRVSLLDERVITLEQALVALGSQMAVPTKPASEAETIRRMLACDPSLTAVEIKRKTGIKAGTIRVVMSRLRKEGPLLSETNSA
jgi:hypothetical protein